MEPAFSQDYIVTGREDKGEAREEGKCKKDRI
jgi:hypothetical protein